MNQELIDSIFEINGIFLILFNVPFLLLNATFTGMLKNNINDFYYFMLDSCYCSCLGCEKIFFAYIYSDVYSDFDMAILGALDLLL
jgi:hypothetical protein